MFEIKPKTFHKILVGVDDAPDAEQLLPTPWGRPSVTVVN